MNNAGWNSHECQPTDDAGNPMGPVFGFWKGETHNSDGQN